MSQNNGIPKGENEREMYAPNLFKKYSGRKWAVKVQQR